MAKFDGKAVFVVGAGASAEYDLPTGRQLKNRISSELTDARIDGINRGPDNVLGYALAEAAHHNGIPTGAMERAAQLVARAMPQVASIDNFLHMHSGDISVELCGKLAIVKIILDAEASSKLARGGDDPHSAAPFLFTQVEDTWANWLVQLLCTACPAEGLAARFKQLALVIFNYDRCFEHFLFHSLLNIYGHAMTSDRAAELVSSLEIYHPYGSTGSLGFMSKPGETPTSFGSRPGSDKLRQLATNIKTFTEGTRPDSSEIVALRDSVSSCARLVFLGFGYAEQNLDLLFGPKRALRNFNDCIGTCSGMSGPNVEMAKSELKRLGMGGKIEFQNVYCAQFMQNYAGPLAFA